MLDENVSLGHRRLSIVDLSELGRQPMVYERGGRRVIVTFNGEIFNFREIRHALETKGYRFHTGTDTEIILASYLEWGSECVQRVQWHVGVSRSTNRRRDSSSCRETDSGKSRCTTDSSTAS